MEPSAADPRITAALYTLSSLQAAVSECELRVQRKEGELGERLGTLEGRLLEDVQRAVLGQRAKFRLAVRGVLQAIGEEEERRLALEAAQELRMKEAEAVWREQMIHTHQKLGSMLGELAAKATARAKGAEDQMLREVAELAPGTARLADEAAAVHERVQGLQSEAAAAVEALRARHGAYDEALAEARRELEQTAAGLHAQVEELARKVEQATAGVDGSAARADELLLRMQAATERETERALTLLNEARATAVAHSCADAERMGAATRELHAAAAMVGTLRPAPGADIAPHAEGLGRLAIEFSAASDEALRAHQSHQAGSGGAATEASATSSQGASGNGPPGPPPAKSGAGGGGGGGARLGREEAEEEQEVTRKWAESVQLAEATARAAVGVSARVAPLESALSEERAEAGVAARKMGSLYAI